MLIMPQLFGCIAHSVVMPFSYASSELTDAWSSMIMAFLKIRHDRTQSVTEVGPSICRVTYCPSIHSRALCFFVRCKRFPCGPKIAKSTDGGSSLFSLAASAES